jgi:Flp pilus assembly protein CpaB
MQNRRGLIFIGLAVIMGLAAAWITTEIAPNSANAEVAAIQTTPVVAVRSDVSVATSLTKAQLKLVDWPTEHMPRSRIESSGARSPRVSPSSRRHSSRSARPVGSAP